MIRMSKTRYDVFYRAFESFKEEGDIYSQRLDELAFCFDQRFISLNGGNRDWNFGIKPTMDEMRQLLELEMIIERGKDHCDYQIYNINPDYKYESYVEPKVDDDLLARRDEFVYKINLEYMQKSIRHNIDAVCMARDLGLSKEKFLQLESMGLFAYQERVCWDDRTTREIFPFCIDKNFSRNYERKKEEEMLAKKQEQLEKNRAGEKSGLADGCMYWIIVAVVLLPVAFFTNKGFPAYFEGLFVLGCIIAYKTSKRNDEVDKKYDKVAKWYEEEKDDIYKRYNKEDDQW